MTVRSKTQWEFQLIVPLTFELKARLVFQKMIQR